jgi:hypothetical protein
MGALLSFVLAGDIPAGYLTFLIPGFLLTLVKAMYFDIWPLPAYFWRDW